MSRLALKVSVLMPVYNGSRYLRESVDSILNQTFTDFEFIIIDDGSTDDTWEILSTYADKDQRIRLLRNEENLGLIKSLNKGLSVAKGDYIARQDADDISLPKRFDKQIAVLDHQQEVILVSCDLEIINSEGDLTGKFQRACDRNLVAWYLIFYNRVAGHSQVMFRRKLVSDLGGYSQINKYSEDYELWCRLAQVNDIVILPEVLLRQRMHSKSLCAKRGADQEVWSLTQSRQNIKQLIKEEIDLEEVEDLRLFWIGHWWKCFPDTQKASVLHSRLQQILQGFIQQNSQKYSAEMTSRLRLLIGQQFIYWLRALSIRNNLLEKIKISTYAFAWHPLGVVNYWLKDAWNVHLRKLPILFNLNYQKDSQPKSENSLRQ